MDFKRFEEFDFNKNFWECFPEVLVLKEFLELKNNDKSKGFKDSSNFMWVLHLCLNPKSTLFNIPNKFDKVSKSILKKGLNVEDVSTLEYINAYKQVCLTPGERAYLDICAVVEKRASYLSTLDYNLDDGPIIDKLHANTFKIYQDLEKVRKIIQIEQSKTTGRKATASETGKI
jgi:hypothetical protein